MKAQQPILNPGCQQRFVTFFLHVLSTPSNNAAAAVLHSDTQYFKWLARCDAVFSCAKQSEHAACPELAFAVQSCDDYPDYQQKQGCQPHMELDEAKLTKKPMLCTQVPVSIKTCFLAQD